jgi:hypothetical protein
MRLHEAVYARLTTEATVSALVGTRVYPLVLPQPPTFPAIAYTRMPRTEQFTDDGPSGLVDCRIQLDCYAATYDGAVVLGDAVRGALNGWKDAGSGVQKSQQVPQTEGDLREPVGDSEGGAESFRVTMDILVSGSED